MNPFDRFTPNAKLALQIAEKESKTMKKNYIGSDHLLIGLLSIPKSLAFSILTSTGLSLENIKMILSDSKNIGIEKKNMKNGLSNALNKIIELAVKTAYNYKHSNIGTEHLLYGILKNKSNNAFNILLSMHINSDHLEEKIINMFDQINTFKKKSKNLEHTIDTFLQGLQGALVGLNKMEDYSDAYKHKDENNENISTLKIKKNKHSKTPALDYFTVDLIEKAKKSELDPIIGRSKEISRVINILNRKNKNNPVLVGEPGVGKTAIAEGLSQAIVNEEVPDCLLNKRILSLSMSSVVAGTKYRGEFEQRIKDIIDEAAKTENDIILFIDELHTVIGTGSAEGSLDAANILKPALSRGSLQVIGATTTDEYRKYIEKDKALERRFQMVQVEEPDSETTTMILNGIKDTYENFHNLIITDDAINSAVTLSKRYITERYLPDKAIDLIDEAASLKGTRSQSNIGVIREKQKKIEELEISKQKAVSNQHYEKALKLKKKQEQYEKEIEDIKNQKLPKSKQAKLNSNDIAEVICRMTGIPVQKLVRSEMKKLLELETLLKEYVIGQDNAITEVSKAIRRSRTGITDSNRPIGSFIFLGPTGVGKTELVRRLAEIVYNNKDALIKIDMSEFMERHSTSRLVGTTAGYVGYEDGGQLTEAVRRKPFSVVLFDEIEKAHPDFFNILLQIFEDGYLTDSKGKKVNFRNTIIIMTSNIGAEALTNEAASIGFNITDDALKKAETQYNDKKEQVLEELKNSFRPEFLNRIDKTIVFKPLNQKSIKKIVKLRLIELQSRLDEKGIKLEYSNAIVDFLAKKGYNPEYGARPVRRVIQEYIEDVLSEKILEGKIKDNSIAKIVRKSKGETLDIIKG